MDYQKNSKSKNEQLRVSVAENENAPVEILFELASDPSVSVRQALALNPSSSYEILEKLSNDKEQDVLIYLAGSNFLPSDIALKLSKHKSEVIRSSIACNEKTSVDILLALSDDNSKDVLEELSRNINTPISVLVKLSKLSNRKILEGLSRNPNSSSEILDSLSKSDYESVREAVAENSNTSGHILQDLASDSRDIRVRVAGNPATPVQALLILAEDKDKYVKEAIKNNPSANVINSKSVASKAKKIDLDEAAQLLFDAFNSDGGLIIETEVRNITIMMLRSGSSVDNDYTLTIEKTSDHMDFEVLSSYFISKDDHSDALIEFKRAIDFYLKRGGSISSLQM